MMMMMMMMNEERNEIWRVSCREETFVVVCDFFRSAGLASPSTDGSSSETPHEYLSLRRNKNTIIYMYPKMHTYTYA
jgi:hypothetical protein